MGEEAFPLMPSFKFQVLSTRISFTGIFRIIIGEFPQVKNLLNPKKRSGRGRSSSLSPGISQTDYVSWK